jgi:hypothetical protein
MGRVNRNARNSEVARTGKIPIGTEVHHSRLRNPSLGYLLQVIGQTSALIESGECHEDWGKKRIKALQKMIEIKKSRLQKKRMGK